MAADYGIGQIEILDHCLEFAAITPGDLATEDGRDLVRPANGAIGVEKPLSQCIQRGASLKDQIVTIFHLGEKQPVLAAGLLALLFGEEGRAASQPLLSARQ
jgi:hypothetical protein